MPILVLAAKDNDRNIELLRNLPGDIKHERRTAVHKENHVRLEFRNPILKLLAVPFAMLPNLFTDEMAKERFLTRTMLDILILGFGNRSIGDDRSIGVTVKVGMKFLRIREAEGRRNNAFIWKRILDIKRSNV